LNKNLFKIGTILWERGQKFFFLFLLPQNFLRRTNVAMEDNGRVLAMLPFPEAK